MWLLKIIAIIIIAWCIPTAFDPKYRYNEHMEWKPEAFDLMWMLILAFICFTAILN